MSCRACLLPSFALEAPAELARRERHAHLQARGPALCASVGHWRQRLRLEGEDGGEHERCGAAQTLPVRLLLASHLLRAPQQTMQQARRRAYPPAD